MEYRYYIGLQLPMELRARIVEVQAQLFNPELVVPALEPHITLLPPPALARVSPEELTPKCIQTAQPFWPLPVGLTTIGTQDGRSILIMVESRQLAELRTQLLALIPAHASVHRLFRPHVTLAQAVRGKKLPASLLEAYEHELAELLPHSFDASQLTLFRWEGPRRYVAEPL
jgi:2'-5' RNA ligase